MTDEERSLGQATVYLAEDAVADFDDVIKGDEGFEKVALDASAGLDGVVYVQRHEARPPAWVEPLAELTGSSLGQIQTQLAGAALLLRLSGRIFAFTFGQGRHLLRPEVLVDDFGLRVAANSVDPAQIRSVDGRTFERGVLLTRRQSSRPGRVEALGLQIDREMIRSITGRSRAGDVGRIHGGTALGVTRTLEFDALETFGRELLTSYSATDYQDAFSQLDQMKPLARTSADALALDADLLNALHEPEMRGAYLAPPRILDWEAISAFRFSGDPRGTRRDELVLREYLDGRGHPVSETELHDEFVHVLDRDSPRVVARWPVYQCLVWETQRGDRAYVLADGRWWRIDGGYLASVNAAVAGIGKSTVRLPPPSTPTLPEGQYNIEAATAAGGVLLDKKLARVRTERGGFELCDIFVPPDKLIHVKRGLGSQELSYLFTQGVQSAEGLRHAREVRQRLRDLVSQADGAAAAGLPVDSRPEAGAFEVVYAVVSGSPQRVPAAIPFFARAALARALRSLDDLDFRSSAIGVPLR